MSGTITAIGSGVQSVGNRSLDGFTVLGQPNDVASTLCASGAGTDRPSAQCSQEGFCVVSIKTANTKANGINMSDEQVMYTLDTSGPHAVAPLDLRHLLRDDGSFGGLGSPGEPVGSLTCGVTGGGNPPAMAPLSAPCYPRRLTPKECERLMGFPDGWTDIMFQGKPARDSLRYRALGNSMAVPVMRWLAEGILKFF